MRVTDQLLWVAFPYGCLAIFIGGHVWRYRQDRFAWTDEWMMLLKPRALRWGIVAFHVGAFAVLAGHVVGILVPKSIISGAGVSETTYRWLAIIAGGVFGACMAVGVGAFLWRRMLISTIRANNQPLDVPTLLLVGVVIVIGMLETIGVNLFQGGYDYRVSVAVWFRDIFVLAPHPQLMAEAPFLYQIHAILAWLVFALWPFSRLVHVWYLPAYARKRFQAGRGTDLGYTTGR